MKRPLRSRGNPVARRRPAILRFAALAAVAAGAWAAQRVVSDPRPPAEPPAVPAVHDGGPAPALRLPASQLQPWRGCALMATRPAGSTGGAAVSRESAPAPMSLRPAGDKPPVATSPSAHPWPGQAGGNAR